MTGRCATGEDITSRPLAADNYHLELGDATSGTTLAQFDGTIDMVVTNPPYIPEAQIPEQPEVRDHDPKAALYGAPPTAR